MENIEVFLKRFNEAFVANDINYIVDCTTDDVNWTMVGEKTIHGKEGLAKIFNNPHGMSNLEINVKSIITNGREASVDGTMRMKDKEGKWKDYGFCDIYKFADNENLKIKELRSYIVDLSTNLKSGEPHIS
ncbi:hypothetical protein BH23BAC2_BH23BAC2_07650 [soil metagenome]